MIMLPALIFGDTHITDRHIPGYSKFTKSVRLMEWEYLKKDIHTVLDKYKCKSMVICGDFIDKAMGISIPTLIDIILTLKSYKIDIHIVAGNHEFNEKNNSPVNSMLLILELLDNVHLYCSTTVIDNGKYKFMMLPYYDFPNEIDENCDVIFSHKDIVGISRYPDEDYAVKESDLVKFNPRYIFNGHMHMFLQMEIPPFSNYTQVGAPYIIRRSDNPKLNRYIHVLHEDLRTVTHVGLHITTLTTNLSDVDSLLKKYSIVKVLLKHNIGNVESYKLYKELMSMDRVVILEEIDTKIVPEKESCSDFSNLNILEIAKSVCNELKLTPGVRKEVLDVIRKIKEIEAKKFQVVV